MCLAGAPAAGWPPLAGRPWWPGPPVRAGQGGGGGWAAALSADPMVWRPASARRPEPELVGVPYCPDVLDPVPCDVERGHRHGDAVLLSDQAGLAVDRALQDRQAGCPVDGGEHVARDPLGAFDRAERDGVGQAAAVGDHGGGGIEEADESVDVLGFPGLLEGPDDAGLAGCRRRGSLRRADAAAG